MFEGSFLIRSVLFLGRITYIRALTSIKVSIHFPCSEAIVSQVLDELGVEVGDKVST